MMAYDVSLLMCRADSKLANFPQGNLMISKWVVSQREWAVISMYMHEYPNLCQKVDLCSNLCDMSSGFIRYSYFS